MRASTILPVAIAAAPLASAAAGTLGFALGARMPNGACKTTADYAADFSVLKPYTSIVRTYSAVDGAVPENPCPVAQEILPAAAEAGIKLVLGVWPDTPAAYKADKEALQKYIPQNADAVYAITVGSEALYRGDLTGPELLDRINDMKKTFPKIKVGTADSWNKYQDGTADALITGGVKFLLVNAFGYWQGQKITNATATYLDDLQQAIGHIQELSGSIDGIEIWNGETGWPSDGGEDYGAAKASTVNAKTFYKSGVCAALDWGLNVFYFEAFDETWKPKSKGDTGAIADETHWGAFTDTRNPKWSLGC